MQDGFSLTRPLPLGDAALAVDDRGEGEPVVLVHGGMSDLRIWTPQMAALAGDYRAIRYSRRYSRPNEPIPGGADDPIEPHVRDLVALIRGLTAAPAHVVGHSWGGLIALLAALDQPELFRSLVLVEPPAITLLLDMPPRPSQLLPLLVRRPRAALAVMRFGATVIGPATKAYRKGDDRRAVEIFGTGVLGAERFRAMPPARYQMAWENRLPDRAQLLGAGFPPVPAAQVRGFSQPVLLVAGADSPRIFHVIADELAALLPEARRVTVPGASHVVQEDAPEAFNACLREFLAGVPR